MVAGTLLYCKEDGGVSGDVNGAEGTVVKGQGPLRSCCDRRAEAGMWIVGGRWGVGCNRERSICVCPIFGTMLLAMIVHQDEWVCACGENKEKCVERETRPSKGSACPPG